MDYFSIIIWYTFRLLYTHVDHYKGVLKLLDYERKYEVKKGKTIMKTTQQDYNDNVGSDEVLVIAPNGFYEEAISENLYLGNCMARRATYMYGSLLPRNAQGQVGAGLGKTVGDTSGTLPKPSFELKMEDRKKTKQLTIGGLRVTFQYVPRTEAPAEFHIYFDDYKAL